MKIRTLSLSVECLFLYGVIPGALFIYQQKANVPFFPVLFGLLILTFLLAWTDPHVEFCSTLRSATYTSLRIRLLSAAGFLILFTALFYPGLLFRLPREQPRVWFLVMLLYPILSVAPQEFLYRTFFMQRYKPLFGDKHLMLLMNALAFGWAHIFFLNWIAPLLSIVAGGLLAHTWQRHQSFKIVCIEHAVYGQIIFTCGLGWFFYQGSARALQQMLP